MFRVLEGVITRRLLLTYRIAPGTAREHIPPALEPLMRGRSALGAVSLTRLDSVRPRGLSAIPGLAIESMAHSFAVTAEIKGRQVAGVYVARRDTESRLVALLGGRLFAGNTRLAQFVIEEDELHLELSVRSGDGDADMEAAVQWGGPFHPSPCFSSLHDAASFVAECDHGFVAGARAGELSVVRLQALPWRAEAVRLVAARSGYFEDTKRFPPGTAELDSAIALRTRSEEWVPLGSSPDLAGEPLRLRLA